VLGGVVKIHSAQIFFGEVMYCYATMHCFLRHLIGDCTFLIVASTASIDAEPPHFPEGHLKIRFRRRSSLPIKLHLK